MTVIVFPELVLVPGFEPGSTDRESDMMDRTTPHERYTMGDKPLFENVVLQNLKHFHFHFQLSPFRPR